MKFIIETPVNQSIQPPVKKAKKTPRILDGTFYSIVSNNDGKIEATCCECGDIRKGDISSTGNFKTHYKLTHPSKMKQLEDYLKKVELVQTEGGTKQLKQLEICNVQPPISQDKVYNFKYNGHKL